MTSAIAPAAILAGGLGTRIRSVGGDVPKVLLPVGDRPFLAHVLSWLAGSGVRDVVLLLGHKSEEVLEAAHAHAPLGLRIQHSVEPKPLGTAGAVRLALQLLPETFFLINGDTLVPTDLPALEAHHRDHGASVTLTLVASHRAAEKGSVAVGERGIVERFDEKTPHGTGLINAGVYAMQATALRHLPEGGVVSLERDVLPELVEQDRVFSVVSRAPFLDIGLPEDYLAVRDGLPDTGGPA